MCVSPPVIFVMLYFIIIAESIVIQVALATNSPAWTRTNAWGRQSQFSIPVFSDFLFYLRS